MDKKEQVLNILKKHNLTMLDKVVEIDALYSDPPSPEMVCPTCRGTRLQAGTTQNNYNQTICETCHGTGSVEPYDDDIRKCPNCNGTGGLKDDSDSMCGFCHGIGKVSSPEPPEKVMECPLKTSCEVYPCPLIGNFKCPNQSSIRHTQPVSLPIEKVREEIYKFLGEQYDPHINFVDLSNGVKADLLWQTDSIILKLQQAGWGQLDGDCLQCAQDLKVQYQAEARQQAYKTILDDIEKHCTKYQWTETPDFTKRHYPFCPTDLYELKAKYLGELPKE